MVRTRSEHEEPLIFFLPHLPESACLKPENAVAHTSELLIMGDQNGRKVTFPPEIRDQTEHGGASPLIQIAGGLIRQQ